MPLIPKEQNTENNKKVEIEEKLQEEIELQMENTDYKL